MPSPRRRPPLTRDDIVTAALAIIDGDGVEALTMRRLGQQLGVDPMAVYYHLPNKAAVLDVVLDHLWAGVRMPPPVAGEAWPDLMFALFTGLRDRLQGHPRAIAILGTRPATTVAQIALIESVLDRLSRAGLSAGEAMPLLDCLSGFTIGKLLAETTLTEHGGEAQIAAAVASVAPDTHPNVVGALMQGYAVAPDEQFERGLRALITGWSVPES